MALLTGVLCLDGASLLAQGLADRSSSAYDIVSRNSFAEAFQKGETNTPLLVMEWFSDSHVINWCNVKRSGKVFSSSYVVNWSNGGGHSAQLSQRNLQLLKSTMAALPPPPRSAPPPERCLVVQGIRSTHWFKNIYDRAHVPELVELLYEITGAPLEWIIPRAEVRQIVRAPFGTFACVANDAPIAVSAGEEQGGRPATRALQIWNLETPDKVPPVLRLVPYQVPWGVASIAPDASVLVAASHSAFCAVDLRIGKVLWQGGPLDHDNYYGKHLAIGNGGRSLFTAGAHNVERWELNTGRNVTLLASDLWRSVNLLRTSHDGSVLLAGYNGVYGSPNLYVLWSASDKERILEFYHTNLSCINISPDGRMIGKCMDGKKILHLYDWKAGQKRTVRLRSGDSSTSVSSIHWSPDGKSFAAVFDQSIVLYNTADWRPLARWECGWSASSNLIFTKHGLIQNRGSELFALDTTQAK